MSTRKLNNKKKKVRDAIVKDLEGEVHTVQNVGAFLLQGITKFLYGNALEACKEYVSNAADAKANHVRISCVPPDYDMLVIVDDGHGISEDEIHSALDIYVSSKREDWDEEHPKIGHFGVGIYAGTLLCDFIRIRTKQKGDTKILELSIPVKRWLDESEVGYDLLLEDVLHYSLLKTEAPTEMIEKSFTTVILEGIGDLYRTSFKDNGLDKFALDLSGITPVGFKPNLQLDRAKHGIGAVTSEKWDFSDYLKDVLHGKFGNKRHCQYNSVRFFVNGVERFRPHPDETLSKTHCFEKSFKIGETLAGIGWAVAKGPTVGPRSGKIIYYGVFKDDRFQGIDTRLLNVPVYKGQEIYNLLGISTADMPYRNIWGEIYLSHPAIRATLPRRDIRESAEWIEVKDQIRDWLQEILRAVERARRPPTKKRKKKPKQTAQATAATEETEGMESGIAASDTQPPTSGQSPPVIDDEDKKFIDSGITNLNCTKRESKVIRILVDLIMELGASRSKVEEVITSIRSILNKGAKD